mgnify:CR=1 FL=1
MDHTEAIVELKNIIDPLFVKKLINFTKAKAKYSLKTESGVFKNVRNVKGHQLNFNTPTNLFYWNCVKKEIERLYYHYKVKFPQMKSDTINQIELLKYTKGGKYVVHTDHFSTCPRHLSVIMNLNENYEGGDLVFTDQHKNEIKRFKLSSRSIVFFPSNFLYPHQIEPITKGTRYSIVAWLQ